MAQYRGWDLDTLRLAADAPDYDQENLTPSRKRSRDIHDDFSFLNSSFTPINQPDSSPPRPSDLSIEHSVRHGAAPHFARKRNPIVADYLGLGQDPEDAKFSLPIQVVPAAPKRCQRTSGDAAQRRKAKGPMKRGSTAKSTHRRISDGMQITKSSTQPTDGVLKPPKSRQSPVAPGVAEGISNQTILSDVTLNKLNSFRFQALENVTDEFRTADQHIEDDTNCSSMSSSFNQHLEDIGYSFATLSTNSDIQADNTTDDSAYALQDCSNTLSKEISMPEFTTETSHQTSPSIELKSDGLSVSVAQDQDTSCREPVFAPSSDNSDDDYFGDLTVEELADPQNVLEGASKFSEGNLATTQAIVQTASISANDQTSQAKHLGHFTDDFDLTDDGLSDTDLLQLEPSTSDTEVSLRHSKVKDVSITGQEKKLCRHLREDPISEGMESDDWVFMDEEKFFAVNTVGDNLDAVARDGFDHSQAVTRSPKSNEKIKCLHSDLQNSTYHNPKETLAVVCTSPDQTSYGDGRKPICRPPFPAYVRDRSPIIGLSADAQLSTCFRIGEALNVGYNAGRHGKTVVIELYARVSSSWREEEGVRQQFIFADLFHNHPPFLEGNYELWKDVELWDYDSGRFLHGSSKMCRCIGKMKKDGKKWKLSIMNIWEASWDDIDYVQGIVCA